MADGMLSLAWNNHSSTFNHMLSTVRDAELYTDVTIACDGKFYPAHKLVLSACSDYFHKIFERTPCKHPVIVIRDVECKNMDALLNYMYAGVVSVSQSDLAQLIRAAELLEIKGLAVPDEPPSGTKRPVHIQDMPVDGSSSNSKKARQEDRSQSNQGEALCSDSSVPSSQLSSSKKYDGSEEQINSYNIYNNKVNLRQTHNEHSQENKESLSCTKRPDELGTDTGQDHMKLGGQNQNEVLRESSIKEENVEFEGEAAEMGFEYESLMTDLGGNGDGDNKKNSSASDTSFNHSLDAEPYSAEAGPSGLQLWPALDEGGETSGVTQSYAGGLPLTSHSGQQPHQMQHMVLDSSDMNGRNSIVVGVKSQRLHQCPYCSYTADFNYLLLRHVRTHTGEKPYCCPQCSYRASRKDSLKQHMATHITLSKIE